MLTRDNLKLQLIYEQQVLAQPQQLQQPQQPQLRQQFQTWGDVKNAIKIIEEILKSKKVKEAGKLFAKIGLSFLPGAAGAGDMLQAVLGTAPDIATALSKIARLPDNKRTNTFIDQLDVDDAISQIVSDDVEKEFLKIVQQLIKGHRDDEPLPPNWNMTNELIKFLKQKYAKSTAVQQHLLDLESRARTNITNTPVPPMQGVNAAPSVYTPPVV